MGDIFVARLRGTDGGVRWAISIGTSGDDAPSTLLVDRAGNLVLAATIGGPLDDEPAEGGGEALLVSLDPADNGATRWRKVISTTGSDYGWDAAIGASGDVLALFDLGGPYDFGSSLIGPANPTSVLMKFAP